MLQIAERYRIQNSTQTHFEATEENYWDERSWEFSFLDTSGHPMSALYTVANIPHMHITIKNLDIASVPLSFFPKGIMGEKFWWIVILMAKKLPFLPSEAKGRQTKLHPGFTLAKLYSSWLVQPSPGISILNLYTYGLNPTLLWAKPLKNL